MFGKATILCCCIAFLFPAGRDLALAADGPASFNRDDIAKYAPTITLQLRSGSELAAKKAIETIRDIANHSARGLSDSLPGWIDPLLECRRYDDILEFTQIAIIDRGFDISTVEKLEEARVQALLGKGELDRALSEGRAYYNVCLLKSTPHAIDLLCSILERQGKSVVASQLRIEQINGPSTRPTTQMASGEGFENGLPTTSVLAWIAVDATPWEQTVNGLDAGHTFNDFMKRGNLALLTDKPELARKCFESACQMTDGASKKNTREAIEGIARSIRDMPDGSPAKANIFIMNLRTAPELAGSALGSGLSADDLRSAAQATTLAQMQVNSIPPLEKERASNESSASADTVKIVTDFECAKPMDVKKISPTHFELSFTSPGDRNWFMVRVEGAAGKTLRIDIKDPFAPLDKWLSFNPVYSYEKDLADPAAYISGEAKNDGPQKAWNGALLPGTAGQKWHYISDVWNVDPSTMAFTVRLNQDAYIGMRVPYTPNYNEKYLRSISNPAAQLIEIGKSSQGRPLLMLKIGSGDEKSKPCIVIYAREHPDEHDTSWAAKGIADFLCGSTADAKFLRETCVFLIIPLLDPDAAAASRHEGFIYSFSSTLHSPSSEAIAYANWFNSWAEAGNRLDFVFDLHNVQSREAPHLACAILEDVGTRGSASAAINNGIVSALAAKGLAVDSKPWMTGVSPSRLGGWLCQCYGALTLAYELNTQQADRHLNLAEIEGLGADFAVAAGRTLNDNQDIRAICGEIARLRQRQSKGSNNEKELLRGDRNALVTVPKLLFAPAIKEVPEH